MSKLKYDVSGATAGGDWEHVPPGLYICKVGEVNSKPSKAGNPMIEVVLKPVATAEGEKLEGEFNNVWHYILTDGTQDSRLRAFIDAVGLKSKGTLDTDAVVGEQVLAQLKSDKDQDDNYRPRVSKLMPVQDGVEVDEEEADEDEEEEDEGVDLDTLNRAELKKLVKDNELDIKVLKSMSDDDLRAAITEALGTGEEEEDEAEDEEEDDEEEGVDLSTLDRAELKKFIKDNELEVRVLKSMSDDDLRAKIAEAMGGEAEDEEEEDASNGYDNMSIADLKAALKERGLSTSGAKKVLVGRLTEDDSKGGDPF